MKYVCGEEAIYAIRKNMSHAGRGINEIVQAIENFRNVCEDRKTERVWIAVLH